VGDVNRGFGGRGGTGGGPAGPSSAEPDWELIAESIPHVVWTAAPDGASEYVNRRGLEYVGLAAEALHDWNWVSVVHPDDVPLVIPAWNEAVASGEPYELEYRVRRADGSYRWQVSRGVPLRGRGGGVVRWIGTLTDIDDRKRAEERLVRARRSTAEAFELLETVLRAAPVGFAFIDRDGCFVRINDEMAVACGIPAENGVGVAVADVLPGIWEQLQPSFRHVLEANEPIRNVPVVGPAPYDRQSQREWLASLYPVLVDGEAAGVGLVAIDVTDRMRAERVRAAVMGHVTDGVYTEDADGRLTSINRAASAMLGWTEAELRGRPTHDVIHCQTAGGVPIPAGDCPVRRAAAHGHVARGVGEWFTRKDGSVFRVACTAVPLRVGSAVDGVAVVFRDLTPLPEAERTLRVLVASADDRAVLVMQAILDARDGAEVVHVATSAAGAVGGAQAHRPDVALVDYDLPGLDGIETVMLLRAAAPGVQAVLLMDGFDEDVALAAVDAGCSGVLDKNRAAVELLAAVEAAGRDGTVISRAELQGIGASARGRDPGRPLAPLTDRECDVLACISEGLSNKEAAERLGMRLNTVRNHVQRILYKLGAHSKLQAAVTARHEGMLRVPRERAG